MSDQTQAQETQNPSAPSQTDTAEAPDSDLAPTPPAQAPGGAPGKVLSAAAIRALEEAQARRKAEDEKKNGKTAPKEVDGRNGPEPVRYGDWELKGTAIDF